MFLLYLALDGAMIRISANYSNEPEPKYKKEMFDKPDSLGGETLECCLISTHSFVCSTTENYLNQGN